MLHMQPVAREWNAGGSFRLCDLVLVMRENEVFPARMDVERLAENRHAHRGALDVPARPAYTPWCFPCRAHVVIDLFRALPQNEIARIRLLILIRIDPARTRGESSTAADVGAHNARQCAISGKR